MVRRIWNAKAPVIRGVFFDDDHNALWIGSNHGSPILKVEPLD
jgi:hypothetical protein